MKYSNNSREFKKLVILIFNVFIANFLPTISWAQSPVKQPETATYMPAGVSEMVQLQTGNFSYNIPLMNIPGQGGGYPLTMFYTADEAVKPGLDASWVGLGWNINPGSIHRDIKGIPDDWSDKLTDVVNYTENFNAANGSSYSTKDLTKPDRWIHWAYTGSNKHNFGSLYMAQANMVDNSNGHFPNRQNTSYVADVYSNAFNYDAYKDAKLQAQHNSLSFPDYDSYSVSGQGISGNISPKLYEFGQLLQGGQIFSNNSDKSVREQVNYYSNPNYKFTKPRQEIYFQFNYDASGYSSSKHYYANGNAFTNVKPGEIVGLASKNNYIYSAGSYINPSTPPVPENMSMYNSSTKRSGQGKHIEYFTNAEIDSYYSQVVSRGFIETPSQKGQRGNTSLYDPTGIGAFSITTEDGTTYHYSIPVYQFESFLYFQEKNGSSSENFQEFKQFNMYATDWLLTSITGADYVDNGTIADGKKGMIDESDFGYYVQFDYGKWTDGYIWRTPYKDDEYIQGPAGSNYQSYAFGRKQIYYLNSIKTNTHTAYFIKKLRLDGMGKSGISNYYKKQGYIYHKYGEDMDNACFSPLATGYYLVKEEQREIIEGGANYQLKLDKIILLNNEDAKGFEALQGINSGSPFIALQNGTTKLNRHFTDIFQNGSSVDYECNDIIKSVSNFQGHYQNNVLDYIDVQNVIVNIEQKSLKLIEFDLRYLLCGNTPGSVAPGGNKLTLRSINTYGLKKVNKLPPYIFSYKGESPLWPTIQYLPNNIDNWGYYSYFKHDMLDKIDADAWSLKEITTPMGGKIKINYESDTYSNEAVFGRFTGESCKSISVNYSTQVYSNGAYVVKMGFPISQLPLGYLVKNRFYDLVYDYTSRNLPNQKQPSSIKSLQLLDFNFVDNTLTFNFGFWNTDATTHQFTLTNINAYGGGIRVKDISVNDGAGNTYKKSYTYTNPFSKLSSGVTSYAPNFDNKYIPYLNEIPPPEVLYQYVTVEEKGTIDQSYLKTRYKFDVLETASNAFNLAYQSNFIMGNKISVKDYKTNSLPITTPDNQTYYSVNSRNAIIEDNKAALGRLLEVVILNKGDQVQSKDTYQYFEPISNDIYKNGITYETFGEIKEFSIWDQMIHTNNWQCFWYGRRCHLYQKNVRNWYLTSSSRKTYPNLLKSITHESNGMINKEFITKYDFFTGAATETEVVNNDGLKYRNRSLPAFYNYGGIQGSGGMGSKNFNANSKNMLFQESANYRYFVTSNNQEKLLGASVQTWKKNWTYRDYYSGGSVYLDGTVSPITEQPYDPVWRKYKNFVWKSPIVNTAIANFVDFYGLSTPDDSEEGFVIDPHWQKINQITRYDHFSNTIEAVDINGNYSANKLGRDSRFAVASSVASMYRDFTHSGFEDLLNSKYFEGEVALNSATQILSGTAGITSHTGKYMVKIPNGLLGPTYSCGLKESIGTGKTYRASVWVRNPSPTGVVLAALLDGTIDGISTYKLEMVNASQATIQVGEWKLLTVDIDVPQNYSPTDGLYGYNDLKILIYNSAPTGFDAYVDDLRVQAIGAPAAAYIYDKSTGFLDAMLDNENFATFYTYDEIGRLLKTEKETLKGTKIKVSETEYTN